jgi:hypothetical protein
LCVWCEPTNTPPPPPRYSERLLFKEGAE